MKKISLRRDIVSRNSYSKENLIRLVIMDNKLTIDENNCLKGRGFYIKKDVETISIARKKNLLKKYCFDGDIYSRLESLCAIR